MILLDRFKGCLLGLAVGDALGTTLEFADPQSPKFSPIADMVGGGPFNLPVGYWTDDTSMALCSAESLLRKNGFDANDHLNLFVKWWTKGYMSPTGACFDIGNTIHASLKDYLENATLVSKTTSDSNGTLMRFAPIALFYYKKQEFSEIAKQATVITHGSELCKFASQIFAEKLSMTLDGSSKDHILKTCELHDIPKELLGTAFGNNYVSKLDGSGYVVSALETVLHIFGTTDDFKTGALQCANLGNDADTTAAIFGQIAGAYYGIEGIPQDWLKKLYMRNEMEEYASRLYDKNKEHDFNKRT